MSAIITIAARFSLLVGAGPFDNESVQNALGFGIDWDELEEEIGEVIIWQELDRAVRLEDVAHISMGVKEREIYVVVWVSLRGNRACH